MMLASRSKCLSEVTGYLEVTLEGSNVPSLPGISQGSKVEDGRRWYRCFLKISPTGVQSTWATLGLEGSTNTDMLDWKLHASEVSF